MHQHGAAPKISDRLDEDRQCLIWVPKRIIPAGYACGVALPGITFGGPPVDDDEVFDRLPADLQAVLTAGNGFVAYDGGLHVRGACHAPGWHSLRVVWIGEDSLHRFCPALTSEDVPFAEDAVGDQWLLRGGVVIRLAAETGDVKSLGIDLSTFLRRVEDDPIETLGLQPLMRFTNDGGVLQPGRLLNVYPPFCTEEAAGGVSLSAVPSSERLRFLADLARQMPDVGRFRIKLTE